MVLPRLYHEVLRGGPFDGLPSLVLTLEDMDATIDYDRIIRTLPKMRVTPIHFRFEVNVPALGNAESVASLVRNMQSRGITVSVEAYDGFHQWMRLANWITLHEVSNVRIEDPVDMVVYHTPRPPEWNPSPLHVAKPPLVFWEPPHTLSASTVMGALPQNIRVLHEERPTYRVLLAEAEE